MAPSETLINPSKSENLYARSILDTIQNTPWIFGIHEAKIVKMILIQSIVINKLSIETKPEFDSDGRVMYVPNVSGKPYLITDSHRDSPVGFGVKVSATKKTYIIQRRVSGGSRSPSEGKAPSQVIRSTIGNVSDFSSIDQVREVARTYAQSMKSTKRNPNAVKREADIAELTLSEIFDQYRQHLLGRSKPAKPNSIRVLDKAEQKLKEWERYRVRDLTGNIILKKFDEMASRTRTTAEQTFRWANVAVQHAIDVEAMNAQSQQRHPFSPITPLRSSGCKRNTVVALNWKKAISQKV